MGRTLNSKEIAVVIIELDQALEGAILQDARQPVPPDLYLELRTPGQSYVLVISASPDFSRLHLTSSRPQNPAVPFGFQSLLRARVCGERLVSARQLDKDRVAELEFSGGFYVIAELTGRHSNVFLCEGPERTIISSLRPTTSQRRPLVQGRPYQRPFPLPVKAESEPGLYNLQIPGFPADAVVHDHEGHGASFNEYLDHIYKPLLESHDLELVRARAAGIVAQEQKRLSRLLGNVSKDLKASFQAPEYLRFGGALKHGLHLVRRGADQAVLPEYGPEGVVELNVPLKPALSPNENMERYFRLAKRLSAARNRIEDKRGQIERRTAEMGALLDKINAAQDADKIDRLLKASKLSRLVQGAGNGECERKRSSYTEYFIPGVGRLLAGGKAEDNDELTFRVARGNDLWFHVMAFPGAHVVARLTRDQEPTQSLINAGARLAASRSRAPEGEKVEVAWTKQKYVKKPKGAKPGAVLISRERRVVVEVQKGVYSEYAI